MWRHVNPGLHSPGWVPRRETAGWWARLCLTLHETAHLFSREAAPWLPFIWIWFTWPEAVHLFPRHVEASDPGECKVGVLAQAAKTAAPWRFWGQAGLRYPVPSQLFTLLPWHLRGAHREEGREEDLPLLLSEVHSPTSLGGCLESDLI